MLIGIDIGGTKCAVVQGDREMNITGKVRMDTGNVKDTLEKIFEAVEAFGPCEAIGVSCGGPLDEENGIICSPPNLPGWDDIHITEMLTERFGVPAYMRNDANACALAEWRYGAGKGTNNMIFLTFGTGMGAGLILNGALYSGTNGNAGEVGHMRLERFGPVGYGKMGSLEGFCSGGGMAQLGKMLAERHLQTGAKLPYKKEEITAKLLAEQARLGDPVACETYRITGEKLGFALSLMIDMLNPEAIVIGSVFARSEDLLRDHAERIIREEALPQNSCVCKLVPAALGEKIGDIAALTVAVEGLRNEKLC